MKTLQSQMWIFSLIVLLGVSGIAAWVFAQNEQQKKGQQEDERQVFPFPDGFDYPKSAEEVEGWVQERNGSRIREHGWYLWAGLNQTTPNDLPVWRSWYTSTQAFDIDGTAQVCPQKDEQVESQTAPLSLNAMNAANASTEGEDPINLPHPYYPVPEQIRTNPQYKRCYCKSTGQLLDGPTFQNNGDIMVAGVIYDAAAFRTIRENKLYLAQHLTSQLPAKPGDPPNHIAQFPHTAMVLKPMMWPVQSTGYTALPVWDNLSPAADDGKYIGYEIQQKWERAVAITPADIQAGQTQTVTYLYGVKKNDKTKQPLGPNTYENAPVASVKSFYHRKFSQDKLDAMDPCDRAILDASAYWAYNRAFEANDYLVTIAMHIITKEQPSWTFQSVWWSDKPDKGRYASHRPQISHTQAPGPWDNYLMTSTYGMAQKPKHQHTWPPNLSKPNQKWPVAYNPYIELAAAHPIETNCMNCHSRAAWPSSTQSIEGRESNYQATGPDAPDALDIFTDENSIFDGLLTLDAQWAVSDRAH